MSRHHITHLLFYLLCTIVLYSCTKRDTIIQYKDVPKLSEASNEIAAKWADVTLYTIRFSAFNTPTYSSRSLGYLGLAMYESIVQGDEVHRTLNGQLNGLTLPLPETGKPYYWLLALNASQDTLLKLLYPVPENAHRVIHERIDSLYKAVFDSRIKDIAPETIDRSVKFGQAIALAIYSWSVMDGGDKAYTRNFEPGFVFPDGPSYWVPPVNGQTLSFYPLHPRWGQNRTFITANKNIPVPSIVPYSTDTSSPYYKMYKSVYDKNNSLTQEEKEIAAWWGDDPTETFSPPGHSYYLTTLAIKKSSANLMKSAESYARTGMAVADAFINCWKAKTTYFNERPFSYIIQNINNTWQQFWPEPPFPAFPSGHATQAAAAATVLTDLYGDPFPITDNAHEGHRRYDFFRFFDLRYPSRSFNGFWDFANECAYSRFLGGIHTKQDNDAGMEEGRIVGANVNALQWRK